MSAIRHGQRPDSEMAIGVDLGATWMRVQARRGERQLSLIAVRAAPLQEIGRLFRTLWRRRGWTARTVGALVVASRGVWTIDERRAMAHRLRGMARRVVVLSDAQAAHLGALGGRPGVLILSGTGSIVIGRKAGGRWARAGGLGPLLGDEGSAFWLGQQWLRITTGGEDFHPARRLVRGPDAVTRVAALAPACPSGRPACPGYRVGGPTPARGPGGRRGEAPAPRAARRLELGWQRARQSLVPCRAQTRCPGGRPARALAVSSGRAGRGGRQTRRPTRSAR
jgi:hypothetical protein